MFTHIYKHISKDRSVGYEKLTAGDNHIKNNNIFRSSDLDAFEMPGFEDGQWYRIVNLGDNTVVHFDSTNNRLICGAPATVQDDSQCFQAILQGPGTDRYKIASKIKTRTDLVQVWDFLLHKELLVQRRQLSNDKPSQFWSSEQVPGMNSLFLILSGLTTASKCLRNMNTADIKAQQIRIWNKTEESVSDPFTHWKLEPLL